MNSRLNGFISDNPTYKNIVSKIIQNPLENKCLVVSNLPISLEPTFFQLLNSKISKSFAYSRVGNDDTIRLLESIHIFNLNTNINELLNKLVEMGYRRIESKPASIGEYSLKGDSMVIKTVGYVGLISISFIMDKIEFIRLNDELDYSRYINLDTLNLYNLNLVSDRFDLESVKFSLDKNNLSRYSFILIDKLNSDFKFDFSYPAIYFNQLELFKKDVDRYVKNGFKIFINLKPEKRKSLEDIRGVEFIDEKLISGFLNYNQKLVVFTEKEIFATLDLSTKRKGSVSDKFFDEEVRVGDYIVHENYGIGIYQGLKRVENENEEYMEISYAQKDKLLIPLSQVDKLTKYIGEEGVKPEITRLGKTDWKRITANVKKNIAILAKHLLSHFALQQISKAPIISNNSSTYREVCEDFEFELTPDQELSIKEISSDIEKEIPMNRLLIGDVGFGKTEIALRIAYKAVEAGNQVALLCPTTILCYQHYNLFKKRLDKYGVTIGMLSGFNTPQENNKIIEDCKNGKIDIVIGTHRLLSNDIKLPKLGLLIIDEEQRFGVKQKEKIKALRYGVHVLSMSATPIPRTLSLALAKIQSISVISTPPKDRKPIITKVSKINWEDIKDSITYEINRGGQIYFVHNDISTLNIIKNRLLKEIPRLRIGIAHGRMVKHSKNSKSIIDIIEESEEKGDIKSTLEQVILDFYFKKYDVLLTTTIIENGIDISNVNTIIINNAQKMGLSQLYQLRGRVGRSMTQAYAYIYYTGVDFKKEDENIETTDQNIKYLERFKAILEANELGAGFKVATRDLQIRGAGNILGKEQSGKINLIGYGLYLKLLDEEIEKLKKENTPNL